MNAAQRFARIVDEFRAEKSVTLPSEEGGRKKGFGSSGLRVKGKVFSMLSLDNSFVLKLPRDRVDVLVSSGDGDRFDPRRNGRVMQEWIVMRPGSGAKWLQLAREARNFVDGSAQKIDRRR